MTEQQEIQLKRIFMKHCKNVNGFLTVDSNTYPDNAGVTDFDLLVEEVFHSLVPKKRRDNF